MSFLFFIFCNFFLIYSKSESEEEKLIFVMTHFRHGARAPQHYYFPDDYKDYVKEYWDNPGELTGVGQRMHYLLGIRNRLRYIDEFYEDISYPFNEINQAIIHIRILLISR